MLRNLLEEVIKLLSWHVSPGGETVDTFFTRQLHERIRGKPLDKPEAGLEWVKLIPEGVRVLEESWSLDRLMEFSQFHERSEPVAAGSPLIVYRHGVSCYLIDGQNRVNRWRQNMVRGPHRVLVVERHPTS